MNLRDINAIGSNRKELTFTGVTIVNLDLVESLDPVDSFEFEANDEPVHYYLAGRRDLTPNEWRAPLFMRVPASSLAPLLFPS